MASLNFLKFLIGCALDKVVTKMEGDFTEVGVLKGVSTEIICKAKNNKPFHLFDTFESFPEISKYDNAISSIERKYFTADFEKIKEKFSKYENVRIYKGLFPQTSGPIKD